MVLLVYYDLISPPCRAVILFLKKNKIQFEPKLLALRKNESRTEDFLSINPGGKVPFIQDTEEDFKLSESVTIIKYLHAKYKAPNHWYPHDLIKRTKVNEFCDWHHFNSKYFSSLIYLNEFIYVGEIAKVFGDIYGYLDKMLGNLDKLFLKNNRFLLGAEISIADILASCELLQAATSGLDVLKNHPRLRKWMERVRDEMNPHFDEAHKYVYRLRDISLNKKKSKL